MCGEDAARVVMANAKIIHARCHACGSNLLAEVMALEEEHATEDDGSARGGELTPPREDR